jgi:hypothetical protein
MKWGRINGRRGIGKKNGEGRKEKEKYETGKRNEERLFLPSSLRSQGLQVRCV